MVGRARVNSRLCKTERDERDEQVERSRRKMGEDEMLSCEPEGWYVWAAGGRGGGNRASDEWYEIGAEGRASKSRQADSRG